MLRGNNGCRVCVWGWVDVGVGVCVRVIKSYLQTVTLGPVVCAGVGCGGLGEGAGVGDGGV